MDHIKGILFDKDGTLFDFQTTWGTWTSRFFLDVAGGDQQAAAEMSLAVGYDMEAQVFAKDSVIISHTADEVTAAIGKLLPDWAPDDLLAHVNHTAAQVPQLEAVPLVPLFTGFRGRGLKLGVATNDAESPARAHLGRAGIIDLLDFIAGYDSGFGGKPAPGMQHGFCEKLGLSPGEVLMVGDSAHDLIAGRAAGMTTIAVLTGISEAHELAPYADEVFADIGEIPSFLGH